MGIALFVVVWIGLLYAAAIGIIKAYFFAPVISISVVLVILALYHILDAAFSNPANGDAGGGSAVAESPDHLAFFPFPDKERYVAHMDRVNDVPAFEDSIHKPGLAESALWHLGIAVQLAIAVPLFLSMFLFSWLVISPIVFLVQIISAAITRKWEPLR